ncbi:MAG: AAA family ATPase [Candidatus Marinimicrobia bacterium]|nr:AAA family ATPase [Candidatus Neomarinimicrobiota bacterium]
MAKKIFIAATGRNVGKTSISLGLINSLLKKGHKVGYIKPMSQRYSIIGENKIPEDVLVMSKNFVLQGDLKDMGPFVVGKEQTSKYITGKLKSPRNRILKAFKNIEKKSDIVIIEGTGHGGVGSVFNLSNARVAKLLNAPVLIISEGGVGSTIDRIALNYSLFASCRCRVLGVIINKIKMEKYEKISNLLKEGLRLQNDLDIFGFIPHKSILSVPTLSVIKAELNAKILNEDEFDKTSSWNKQIEDVVVATREPHVLMESVTNSQSKTLIITSSDRTDVLLAALVLYHSKTPNLAGLLLSGETPPESIMKELRETGLPVLIAEQGIYTLASLIHNLIVKITSEDETKIEILTDLFTKHVEVERLYNAIFAPHEIKANWRKKIKLFLSKIFKLLSHVTVPFVKLKEMFVRKILKKGNK